MQHSLTGSLDQRLWASAMINELIAHNITYFCISPGSRSTPLVLAISENIHAETFIHFDERSMAFHALGYAKGLKKPSVIIVTSGTACGNLLPAIMEASESNTPLIILTADRPYELQDCGANQTTDQSSLFKNFVKWQQTIPPADPLISIEALKASISFAILKSTQNPPGPVHLNCMFREPFNLFAPYPLENFLPPIAKTSFFSSTPALSINSLRELASLLQSAKRGLIILGGAAIESFTSFKLLSDILNWPIFSDFLSNYPLEAPSISHYNLACKLPLDPKFLPDCILHFGGSFVSKPLLQLLNQAKPTYLHINATEKRADPLHLVTHNVLTNQDVFCKEISSYLSSCDSSFFNLWDALNNSVKESVEEFFEEEKMMSEPHFFHTLSKFDFSHHLLFIGNSMPIRDAGDFFHPQKSPRGLFCNRGLSGIDGNIATAIGIASGLYKPMVAIIGDLTFLYDCTSLSQLKCLKHPLILIVLNNNGGNIFSHLPIYKNKETCISYFISPHNIQLSNAAHLFDVPYFHYELLDLFLEDFSTFLSSPSCCIIEIKTDRENNLLAHKSIKQELSYDINFSSTR